MRRLLVAAAVIPVVLVLSCSGEPASTDPEGEVGAQGGAGGLPGDAELAIVAANVVRERAGLPSIVASPELAAAAAAHARFYADNVDAYAGGLSAHQEPPGAPGSTGATGSQRVSEAGFRGSYAGEVMNYSAAEPASVVADWMETVFHRVPFVDPDTTEAGYGTAELPVNVMDFGRGPPRTGVLSAWPPEGADDVPTLWHGREIPEPTRPPGGWPSGPVVTLCFPAGDRPRATVHELVREGGTAVEHTFLEPANTEILRSCLALYANVPLEGGTLYSVHLAGVATEPFDLTWTFRTMRDLGCDPFDDPCPAGRMCAPDLTAGVTQCLPLGRVSEGDRCTGPAACAPGLTCMAFTEERLFACHPLCVPAPFDRAGPPCSERCATYSSSYFILESPRLGVCVP